MNPRHAAASLVPALLAASLLAGCSSNGVDKSGASPITSLTVGYSESGPNSNGQFSAGTVFMAELRRLFGDRLDLIEKPNLGGSRPGGDAATARAIANGEINAGWVAARAFSDAGIHGLDALAAPMVIENYAAEAAIVEADTAQPFLDELNGSGLTGLALAVGGLRRPVSSGQPLLDPTDWSGTTVGIHADSQRPAFAALGANPVTVPGTLQNGFAATFTAAELDIGSYDSQQLGKQAPYVTANVVLWPKIWVLVVNSKFLASLTDEEQRWVRDAAVVASRASAVESHDETSAALRQCETGARFPSASSSQVDQLRAAFAPALAQLAADPVDGPLLDKVLSVAARHPGPQALALPDRCAEEASPFEKVRSVPATRSTIPPGTYRMTLAKRDLLDAGVPADRAEENDLIVTLTLKADGTYRQTGDDIDPVGADFTNLIWEAGTYTGAGSTVYFVPDIDELRRLKEQGVNAAVDEPGVNLAIEPYSMTWSFNGDSLTFSDVVGMPDPIGVLWLVAHPYDKIG